jgi:hypothetical protein
MIRLSRRALLISGAAGAVVAGTGLAGIGVAQASTTESMIRAVIRDRFPDIRMSDEDFNRFTADYLTYTTVEGRRWLVRLAGWMPGLGTDDTLRASLPAAVQRRLVAAEDDIMHVFLMSTDFFLRQPEDGPTVSYLAYGDPLVSPCSNPLASFDA